MITAPTGWDDIWGLPDTVMQQRILMYIDTAGVRQNVVIGDSNLELGSVTVERVISRSLAVGAVGSAVFKFRVIDYENNASAILVGNHIYHQVRLYNSSASKTTNYVTIGDYTIADVSNDGDGAVSVVAYDAIDDIANFNAAAASINTSVYTCLYRAFNEAKRITEFSQKSQAFRETTVHGHNLTDLYVPDDFIKVNAKSILENIALINGKNIVLSVESGLKYLEVNSNVHLSNYSERTGIDCEAMSIDYNPLTQEATGIQLSQGSNVYASNLGYLVSCSVKNDSDLYYMRDSVKYALLDPEKGYYNARTIAKNVKFQNARYASVTVPSVTPLLELGDAVNVPTNEVVYGWNQASEYQAYLNFIVQGYRLTFAGDCYGELFTPTVDDAVTLINQVDAETSSYEATLAGSTRAAIVQPRGLNIFTVKYIPLRVGDTADTVQLISPNSFTFDIDYYDADDVLHTGYTVTARRLSNRSYYPVEAYSTGYVDLYDVVFAVNFPSDFKKLKSHTLKLTSSTDTSIGMRPLFRVTDITSA